VTPSSLGNLFWTNERVIDTLCLFDLDPVRLLNIHHLGVFRKLFHAPADSSFTPGIVSSGFLLSLVFNFKILNVVEGAYASLLSEGSSLDQKGPIQGFLPCSQCLELHLIDYRSRVFFGFG